MATREVGTVAHKYINVFFEIPFRVFEIRFLRASVNYKFPKIEFTVLFTVAMRGDRLSMCSDRSACAVIDRPVR